MPPFDASRDVKAGIKEGLDVTVKAARDFYDRLRIAPVEYRESMGILIRNDRCHAYDNILDSIPLAYVDVRGDGGLAELENCRQKAAAA